MSIQVGQVYAATNERDFVAGIRQRRRVVRVDLPARAVWLQTEDGVIASRPSCLALRSPRSRTIPGHRLVEDVQS